jgi:hypothetical protein
MVQAAATHTHLGLREARRAVLVDDRELHGARKFARLPLSHERERANHAQITGGHVVVGLHRAQGACDECECECEFLSVGVWVCGCVGVWVRVGGSVGRWVWVRVGARSCLSARACGLVDPECVRG